MNDNVFLCAGFFGFLCERTFANFCNYELNVTKIIPKEGIAKFSALEKKIIVSYNGCTAHKVENLWRIGVKLMADEREVRTDAQEQPAASAVSVSEYSLLDLGFTGNYTHGLDAKGRLIIPASFREALGDRFAVCLSPDFHSIALYPLKAWVQRRDEYIALCQKNATLRKVLDQFTKYSYVDSEMDAQGRLLLPSVLRNRFLSDVREVDVNGAYDHIIVEDSRLSRKADEDFDLECPDVLSMIAGVQKG